MKLSIFLSNDHFSFCARKTMDELLLIFFLTLRLTEFFLVKFIRFSFSRIQIIKEMINKTRQGFVIQRNPVKISW